MSFDEARWRAAATALGLSLFEPGGGYGPREAFQGLVRGRAGSGGGSPSPTSGWMTGQVPVAPVRRNVDVVVLWRVTTSTVTTVDGGSFHDTYYTHVIARIDAPLFLGLALDLHRPLEPFGKMPSLATGDPQFDRAFLLNATFAGPALALFRRTTAPPNDLLDHLHAIARWGTVTVSDSAVDIESSFTDEPEALHGRIASAAALAAFLAARRGALPRDAEEAARLHAFRACAAAERLELDEQRFALGGVVDGGARFGIAVESDGPHFFTALSVEPARPFGVGVRLAKQGAMQLIAGIFGSQDIRVGDDAFDKAFVVKGRDERGVKALFASSAPARAALVELVASASELKLTDHGLFARLRGLADAAMLQRAVRIARAVATLHVG